MKANYRTKKLKKNTISSIILHLTTVICGFILPRLILQYYGSETNGLVMSISHFLSFISLMELGVGAVVQSNLYKPIAEKNSKKINEILSSANKFFNFVGLVLGIYVVILIFVYPHFINDGYSPLYTGLLILAISISFFAQYFFGVVDRLFLTASQLGYVQYNTRIFCLILNTALCCVFMKLGFSIQVVKLASSLIFLLNPIIMRIYINKKFKIDRHVKYKGEPIKQKWNGIAQHAAAVVLGQTDVVVLTLFSTLDLVSVYSTYFLIVSGVKSLVISLSKGIESLIGEMWAKKEYKRLRNFFSLIEWLFHTGTILFFGCTMTLIVPFVQVYTKGITDANYIQPLFGTLLTWAIACNCLRLPYNIMILATGRYKETQHNYIIAAILNIVVSIISVKQFGLVGVAIGTLVALLYQTVWMAHYNSKNILKISIKGFYKQIFIDLITIVIGGLLARLVPMASVSYLSWVITAFGVFFIWLAIVLIINVVVYRENFSRIINFVIRRINSKKKHNFIDKAIVSIVEKHNANIIRKKELEKMKRTNRKHVYNKVHLTSNQKKEVEDFYRTYYGDKISLEWHRYYSAYTTKFDINYIPELILNNEFKRYMNGMKYNNSYKINIKERILGNDDLLNASICNALVVKKDDVFIDSCGKTISVIDISDLASSKHIVIDCDHNFYGKQIFDFNVKSYNEHKEIINEIINSDSNLVVRDYVDCHPSLQNLTRNGNCVVFVTTYRWKNKIEHIPSFIGIWDGNDKNLDPFIDPVFVGVNDTGILESIAYNEDNERFKEYNGIKFENYKIYNFGKIIETACVLHDELKDIGVICWEFIVNEKGEPVVLSATTDTSLIYLSECVNGKGPFGENTKDILRWINCTKKSKVS